jgi:hypothetical protein
VPDLTPEERARRAKLNLPILGFVAVCCLLVGRGCAKDCATEDDRGPTATPAPPGEFDPKTPEDQARCGLRPPLSPIDGEIVGLERFIGRSAHDPDSVDVSDCTNPIFLDGSPGDCWRVTCRVSARNALGATVNERYNVRLDASGIVSATPQ